MELLKEIGMALLLLGVGVFGIGWQIMQWRDEDTPRMIVWFEIIPVPVGLVGVVCLVVGLWQFGKMMHFF